jgi:succinate dehydrogenase flavin-adding protein (antitoxin of CptAB toxin-antitoxin module)
LNFKEFFGFGRKYFSLGLFFRNLQMDSDTSTTASATSAEKYKNIVSDQSLNWLSIVTCSEQLLQLAYQKNWPTLLEMHAQRDVLLESFFKDAIAADLVDNIRSDIQIIQQRDEEIIRLVKNNQQQIGDESQQLHAMKKRITSYLSAEGK